MIPVRCTNGARRATSIRKATTTSHRKPEEQQRGFPRVLYSYDKTCTRTNNEYLHDMILIRTTSTRVSQQENSLAPGTQFSIPGIL